jgi:hypothetical protein
MRFVLKLGWNAVPLRDQLKRDDAEVAHWQVMVDAITQLQHDGLITWASAQSARKKLVARITESQSNRRKAAA